MVVWVSLALFVLVVTFLARQQGAGLAAADDGPKVEGYKYVERLVVRTIKPGESGEILTGIRISQPDAASKPVTTGSS